MVKIDDQSMFIKVDNYEDILKTLNMIKSKLNEVTSLFERVETLRQEENAEMQIWRNMISEIESRVTQVDNVIFEAGASK